MSTDPTEKQQEVLNYINSYFRKYGISPTFREIAVNFRISVGTVQDHLTSLQNKGLITLKPNKPRTIQLRKDLRSYSTIPLPILGVISAGEGISIYEEPNPDSIDVPSTMITHGSGHYCLQVSGFSMAEDGILDGDIIVVRQQASADNGDAVVAIIKDDSEEKATLKRFYHRGDEIELKPRNQQLESKFYKPRQVEVRGKFRGLIRKGGD